jgi:predicted transposase YbfD/YdcC
LYEVIRAFILHLMTEKPTPSIIRHFSSIEDPRVNRQKKHKLQDIFFISICAVICGADNWVAIEAFGVAKAQWFTEILGLEHGIPSHDTFGAVYAAIETEQFSQCFSRWVADLACLTAGEVIAIDGKCLRRSVDKAAKKAAIYMVSAWAQQNNLVLGQVKVDDKSNEITAIPKLLSRLDIAGAVVTIDAMGCQKKIAKQIKEQGGDYVFSLKGNQGNLHDDVKTFFTSSLSPVVAAHAMTAIMVALKPAAFVQPPILLGYKNAMIGKIYTVLSLSPPKEKSATR